MNDNDDKLTKTPARNEGDANFEVSSLSEVKDENGNGIFHMTTRFKWILALSILLLILVCALIYAVYMGAIVAQIWQLAIWGVCGILAIYSVAKKSLAAVILNFVLFFGVSLIPVWQSAHETFRELYRLFFS